MVLLVVEMGNPVFLKNYTNNFNFYDSLNIIVIILIIEYFTVFIEIFFSPASTGWTAASQQQWVKQLTSGNIHKNYLE